MGTGVVQQVSFIVENLQDLKQFYALLKSERVRMMKIAETGSLVEDTH